MGGHVRNNFLAKTSLKTIVVVGAIVVALIPAAILGFGSAQSIRGFILNLLTNRDRFLAQTLASRVDEFLDSQVRLVKLSSDLVMLQAGFDNAALSPVLDAVRRSNPVVVRIFVTDSQGVSIAGSPSTGPDGKSNLGVSYADRAYFQEALKSRQPAVDRRVLLGRAVKQRVVAMAAPIFDAGGQFKGVVALGVDVDSLNTLAQEIKVGRTGYAAIATGEGQPIAHGDQRILDEERDLTKLPVWRHLTSGQTGEIEAYEGPAGETRLGGFATVPGVGWKVWVSVTVAEVERLIAGAYETIVWWVLAALVGVLVLAVLYARMIARPIEALRSTAAGFAAGRLEEAAPLSGPRETVDLAEMFNHMAQSLRQLLAGEREAKSRIEMAVAGYGALAARVAGGDLTARAPASDDGEFAQLSTSLNRMIESLARLVQEIQGAAGDLTSAASEILAATSQQVSATSEEAAAVRQTAATVAEVKQTADLAAQKAKTVAEAAERVTRVAQEGQSSVEESIKGSEDAKARMEALAERILALSEQAHAIAEINATVNDLAEQSNLLAVNASIEAAKAGEAGRGFGVVANEVKALADQCKQATAQVRGILNEIQRATQAAVMAAEQGVKGSEAGVATANRSSAAIRQLSLNVTETAQAAQQIVAASQQQAIGMDQIALAMGSIEQSSEQTVSATRQFEGAARDLNALARRLQGLVEGLSADARSGA